MDHAPRFIAGDNYLSEGRIKPTPIYTQNTQKGCRSNLGHQPVMRPISGAAPNRRWHGPPAPPAPLRRASPRPGQTANIIFKVIQGWTFDGSGRKIVPTFYTLQSYLFTN